MWLLGVAVVVATVLAIAALFSASDSIIEELRRIPRPNNDNNITKYDLEDFRMTLTEIKELLSISCPQCGREPLFCSTIAEQRVWLEEHIAEHKSGKLERRTLNEIIAERHEEEERQHKEFEASHQHLFTPEEEEKKDEA
jgi:hypothetical protein